MKKVLIIFCVTLFVATAGYIYAQGMMGWRGFPMHHHIMHAQNLKILQPQQISQAMVHISESLNEKCNFCHKAAADVDSNSIRKDQWIQGDFALDDSPAITDEVLKKALGYKNRAREMLKMVNYDNREFLNWSHSSGRMADQVNCWICHRGKHDKMVTDYKKEHGDFIDLY
jgi:hypothetical protein